MRRSWTWWYMLFSAFWALPAAGMQHPAMAPCTGGRRAELEVHRVREGQTWGFLVPQGCAFVLCTPWPLGTARFSLPREKAGFQLCQLSRFVGPGDGVSNPGGRNFFQAMLFLCLFCPCRGCAETCPPAAAGTRSAPLKRPCCAPPELCSSGA